MSTAIPLIPTPKGAPPPCPLPLPDSGASAGMARCLVAVSPAIQKARARVRDGAEVLAKFYAHVPFDPATIDETLASPLAQQILMMMGRVMVLEVNVARLSGTLAGNTSQERFDDFVEKLSDPDAAAQLFAEYPVLISQIVNRLDQWAAFSLEFLKHLCEDWKSLKPFFAANPGRLTSINGGAGDTHREGRSVIVAAFEDGSKLVYKPRSMAVDEHFQRLLTWLNDRGADRPFRRTQVLNRDSYGWSEFLAPTGCISEAEISRFYERQGSYVAVLYALNAADFHYENLIAAGEHPILIDLEALFHQRVDSIEDSDPGAAALWHSVIRVGLLPLRLWVSEDYAGIDLSGLSNPAGQLSPRESVTWSRVATDEMHIVRKRVEMIAAQNCPTLNGQNVSALDYAESVCAGFASMYRLLLRHRREFGDLLESFGEDEVRYIARPTRTYATMFYESFHPDLLRDPVERFTLFERLREGAEQCPSLNRLVMAECDDLLRGDIPLFTTRPSSRHLWTSGGECLYDFFNEPAMALVNQKLCEEDLERQLWIVRAAMSTLSAGSSRVDNRKSKRIAADVPGELDPSSEQLILAASAIGNRISQLALAGSEGTNWIGFVSLDERQRQLSPLGSDLYDGLPGVILFLAHLGLISGNSRHQNLALSALKALQRQVDTYRGGWGGVGGFGGWGGVIYVLSHLSVLLRDPSLAGTAENLCDSLEPLIIADKGLDIVGGVAGCAVALWSLQQVRPSARVVEIARACGERLLETARPTEHGVGWICLGNTEAPLTGFAHGNAGIAYSLLSIAELTNEARFREIARAAIEHERAVFSPEQGNWPDLRSSSKGGFATAWCHGAPGIGLARLCSLRFDDDPLLKKEIDTALATTLSAGFGGNHILCHGDLGNVDILLHAAETLREPRWTAHAKRQACRILKTAAGGNWLWDNSLNVETPGFMTGLAGIGYLLLRLADQRRVPCVLALEPPKAQL